MAETASTTSIPACNACDICRKRERRTESASRCLECELSMCKDCSFSHSWIPACQAHTTFSVGTAGSGVVAYQGGKSKAVEDEEGAPQFELQSEFSCASDKDEVDPKIKAVLVLECGVILVSDWANCVLKSYDMDGRFLDDCYFEMFGTEAGRVHGLALKGSKTVYATLPSQNMIASISVERTNDGVMFSKTLHETERRYFGIAHMARCEKLLVGTTDTVHFLSYEFQVVGELKQFSKPYNMGAESPESVLVADTPTNCLYRIGADDKVERIDVGKKKKSLRGVTVDGWGNIFFAAELTSGVGWITDKGMMGWLMTDQVRKAVGVHYQQTNTGHLLVVTELDGTIKVFRNK